MIQNTVNIDKKVTLVLKLNCKLRAYLIDYWEYSKPAPNNALQRMFTNRAEKAKKEVETLTNVLRNLNVLNY